MKRSACLVILLSWFVLPTLCFGQNPPTPPIVQSKDEITRHWLIKNNLIPAQLSPNISKPPSSIPFRTSWNLSIFTEDKPVFDIKEWNENSFMGMGRRGRRMFRSKHGQITFAIPGLTGLMNIGDSPEDNWRITPQAIAGRNIIGFAIRFEFKNH